MEHGMNIDTANMCMVVNHGDKIAMLNPPAPRELISKDEALVLAAWLVTMADCNGVDFAKYLTAVRST